MSVLSDLAWLIPVAPFCGSLFVAVLLISFNITMNRLRKPVSFFLAGLVATARVFTLGEATR